MQAIRFHRYGAPEVMALEPIEAAALPAGHVRIRMQAAGVAPVDTKLRAGLLQQHIPTVLPKVPGRDGTGIVEALGAGVDDLAIGDAVCVIAGMQDQGSYAESLVLPRQRVVARPQRLSLREAAILLQPGASAWIPVVQTAAVGAGMKVLIHAGSGAVGSLMVQLAAHLGAEVWATCRQANADYVAQLGAQHVIAYDQQDFSGLSGFDVVFDMVGGATHDQSYALLKRGGHLVWLVAAPIRERGDEFGVRVQRAMITDAPEALQQVASLAQLGVLTPTVGQSFPLARAADAHALLESGQAPRGRIVLDIP
ncbi:NADP-dependent oxidoreductase [Herbaspirillum sp. alder98]|uniref:NADP-dependent oxidoreductase n=1 Tax=Herbaspirillum sp. alder98 TaxID=2913096 RepID=UPI001CD8AA69|nr:NADP-dependent oxidoreductase [Herbaspirillum sp. alder98]MCA1324448.1 NADP-dependent oxidoreductase [Herbaspirillum sp. alder98]